MSKKIVVQPWFYIDGEELPNTFEGIGQVPRIGEKIHFPILPENKKYTVIDVIHTFREDPNEIVQDIHIYSSSK